MATQLLARERMHSGGCNLLLIHTQWGNSGCEAGVKHIIYCMSVSLERSPPPVPLSDGNISFPSLTQLEASRISNCRLAVSTLKSPCPYWCSSHTLLYSPPTLPSTSLTLILSSKITSITLEYLYQVEVPSYLTIRISCTNIIHTIS